MMRVLESPIVRVGPLLVILATSGCGHDDQSMAIAAIRNGSAAAAIQRHLDAVPECAPVLTLWRKGGYFQADKDDPAAATLVAAGLIELVPGPGDPDQDYLKDYLNYRPTRAARRWFRNVDPAQRNLPYLCFARRVVREVSLVPDGDTPTFGYTFTLENPPRWMARADMIAAFPGVALAYNVVFASQERIGFEKGQLRFDPTYMRWLNDPFYPFGVNFKGYSTAKFIKPNDLAETAN